MNRCENIVRQYCRQMLKVLGESMEMQASKGRAVGGRGRAEPEETG